MANTNSLKYKNYPVVKQKYSADMQRSLNNYEDILQSAEILNRYENKNNLSDTEIKNILNPNVPIKNKKIGKITIENKDIDVYDQFYNFKAPAGQIFTNYKSAGENSILEDMSIRDLPNNINYESDPNLVLSNTNLVRNNLQNYGKEYLLKTNMLNSEAFNNGFAYQSTSTSPYRLINPKELLNIQHSNFKDKEHGDMYYLNKYQLRFDLPTNYINSSVTSWQYVNAGFILPNKDIKNITKEMFNDHNELEYLIKNFDKKSLIFHLQLKYGLFNLDAIKMTGTPCLTKDFSTVPANMNKPVDIIQDDYEYPPVNNPMYYDKSSNAYMKKEGQLHESKNNKFIPNVGEGLYCSINSNYVVMPKNYSEKYINTDSSFSISPGSNSVTMGVVMSPFLRKFIQEEIFEINKIQIITHLIAEERKKSLDNSLELKLRNMYPELNNKRNTSLLEVKSEEEKYTNLFDMQRALVEKYKIHQQIVHFVNSLVIFKLGNDKLFKKEIAKVILDNYEYNIEGNGVYLLLPSLPNQDLMNLKNGTTEKCYDNDCCFKGPAEAWLPENDKNFVPNMYNNSSNLNNDISNLINPECGINPYNAPRSF